MKDSLWSVDLFRCESILLRSHWVMVVMDVFTRRIPGADLTTPHVLSRFLSREVLNSLTNFHPSQ
jgi:hypothetical protein